MTTAQLRVLQAGPLVTLQDRGRFGALRYGVSAAGPMDRLSFAAANASLAQDLGMTAIEISLGGLVLECIEGSITIAITGGSFSISLDAEPHDGWQVLTLEQGQKLNIRGGSWGSWAYLALAGEVEATRWLGSYATASMTNFGGGTLVQGQILKIQDARTLPARQGAITQPTNSGPPVRIRVTLGPQEHHFAPQKIAALTAKPFTVSGAYDRMGMRLEGADLAPEAALSIPSEPILRGSVQVSGDGTATVLLADHGTTGGYPKIATVLAEDQDRLVQLRSGAQFHFVPVTPEEALKSARYEARARQSYLTALSAPRATLSERLMRENLVGGVVADTPD